MKLGKTSVYRTVQAAAQKVPGIKRKELLAGYKTGGVGADVTAVRCNGKWLPLGISVDAVNGWTLSIDTLWGEEAEALQEWRELILEAVQAEVRSARTRTGSKR